MKNEFIPYQQALELKELGFNEPCLGKFYYNHLEIGGNWRNDDFKEDPDIFISAPLYQQTFRWFKENYNLKEDYGIFPHHTIMSNYVLNDGNEENAELECVKELISIVKTKKN